LNPVAGVSKAHHPKKSHLEREIPVSTNRASSASPTASETEGDSNPVAPKKSDPLSLLRHRLSARQMGQDSWDRLSEL